MISPGSMFRQTSVGVTVMPVQMSYSGQNWNVVTGITAGALGLWLRLGPDRLNVFVTFPPFVWLPAVLCLAVRLRPSPRQ